MSDKPSFFQRLKEDFIYGLIVIVPFVATIWLVGALIRLISGPVSSFLGRDVPLVFSFFLTLVIVTLIGLVAKFFFGKAVLRLFDVIITRIPFINVVYRSTKQIVDAFSFQSKNLLGAVLVEYPRKGVYAMGYLMNESIQDLRSKDGTDMGEGKCAVFLPTTPNPTSGFFIYVDKEELVFLDLSVDESIKILMSAGVFTPSAKGEQ